jgi:hypothetical protein
MLHNVQFGRLTKILVHCGLFKFLRAVLFFLLFAFEFKVPRCFCKQKLELVQWWLIMLNICVHFLPQK